jgi:hypothetical protein
MFVWGKANSMIGSSRSFAFWYLQSVRATNELVLLGFSEKLNTVSSQLWSLDNLEDNLEDKALALASEFTVCELQVGGIFNLFFSFLFYTYINPLHMYFKERGRERYSRFISIQTVLWEKEAIHWYMRCYEGDQ